MIKLHVNGETVDIETTADTSLLWVLREHLKLTGTKFGCGVGLCGACTVHIDGDAALSCLIPASATKGKEITTIEGLSADAGRPRRFAATASRYQAADAYGKTQACGRRDKTSARDRLRSHPAGRFAPPGHDCSSTAAF